MEDFPDASRYLSITPGGYTRRSLRAAAPVSDLRWLRAGVDRVRRHRVTTRNPAVVVRFTSLSPGRIGRSPGDGSVCIGTTSTVPQDLNFRFARELIGQPFERAQRASPYD